jgi:hypothetical protein
MGNFLPDSCTWQKIETMRKNGLVVDIKDEVSVDLSCFFLLSTAGRPPLSGICKSFYPKKQDWLLIFFVNQPEEVITVGRGTRERAGHRGGDSYAGQSPRGSNDNRHDPENLEDDPLRDLRDYAEDLREPVNDEYVWPEFAEEDEDWYKYPGSIFFFPALQNRAWTRPVHIRSMKASTMVFPESAIRRSPGASTGRTGKGYNRLLNCRCGIFLQ